MLTAIRKLFSSSSKPDFPHMVQHGAQVIDVRTKAAYKQGHIKGSVNIPLDSLAGQIHQILKDKPVITCCASGMRSAQARKLLLARGFKEVHNGGGWMSLQNKIK